MRLWARKAWALLRLALSFIRELIASNLVVARIVLSPRIRIHPGIIAHRTALKTDLAVTTLANMITLTPGTLTVDLSEDGTTLFIHTINVEDPTVISPKIHDAFESWLLELER